MIFSTLLLESFLFLAFLEALALCLAGGIGDDGPGAAGMRRPALRVSHWATGIFILANIL